MMSKRPELATNGNNRGEKPAMKPSLRLVEFPGEDKPRRPREANLGENRASDHPASPARAGIFTRFPVQIGHETGHTRACARTRGPIGNHTPSGDSPPVADSARERLARRIREAAHEPGANRRQAYVAVDHVALEAAGWHAMHEPSGRLIDEEDRIASVGWCHPLHGWVWRTGTHSRDWYAQPHGELFRFGPFPSIDDAIAAIETTGGAA